MTHSATDLTNFLACSHLALLDRAVKLGAPKPPMYDDPALEVLRKRGLLHEQEYERKLRERGRNVIRIGVPTAPWGTAEYWSRYTDATLEAMRSGVDVIVQGGFSDGTWTGKPDFLERVDLPAGGWSYEVVDTKLARSAKGGALLQVLLYADLVGRLHGVAPEQVHLELGGPEAPRETFRVADYAAYFRMVRDQFLAFQGADLATPIAPDPVVHCQVCAWRGRCTDERRATDHLSLVAGISRRQRDALIARGTATLADLAGLQLPLDPPLEGVTSASLTKVREQARIQLEGRIAGEPRYELLPLDPEAGLSRLPEPSPGDLFFDLEGSPYAHTYGLEYLFGWTDATGIYTAVWSTNPEEEKRAFEGFIDMVMGRLAEHPGMHIYHFASYESTAIKRMMGLHATREAEVDQLLRGGVLVDLHRVVRQGVRASVESYSIKKLEPIYGYRRDLDLRDASAALGRFEAWLELGVFDDETKELMLAVETYNRDDCVSTLRLRDWLEGLRSEAERLFGEAPARPVPDEGRAGDSLSERQAEVAARVDALTEGIPADRTHHAPEEDARWLLAQLLDFHRREDKATWWEYYRCLDLTDEECIEDRATLGGLEYVGIVASVKKSHIHRYRFPPQDHSIRRTAHDRSTKKPPGELVDLDDAAGTIDFKRGVRSDVPHPRSLVPYDHVANAELRDSIMRVADAVIAAGPSSFPADSAAADLLLRRPPRLRGSAAVLMSGGEPPLDTACRLVTELDRTILPIQGPPGAGKTYTGAYMILTAIESGLKVGITGTSHKVICNLLSEVCDRARQEGKQLRAIQKAGEGEGVEDPAVAIAGNNSEVLTALVGGGVQVAAGTAWLWSREEMMGSVDLLFIDEAGQFSLANTVAVAPAAQSLILLGDPQQLQQPLKGVHPPGADASALDHLLEGAATIPPGKGLFLEQTWRLHPRICEFTSEIFYEGRLQAREGRERQAIFDPEGGRESGLYLVPVKHAGNQIESPEESEVVRNLVLLFTEGGYGWIDNEGVRRPITLQDVLVVAPYNAQVSRIAGELPVGARVGTVDKFQGQQAPVVIYSTTSSSAADAPRGMEFLYSRNRLNVATSRAKCAAIVVAAPDLFIPTCTTPQQMKLANAFCRYREMASHAQPFFALAPHPASGRSALNALPRMSL